MAVSLQQREGDHVCVLGTNGAGKATLAAAMLGHVTAVTGRAPEPGETDSVSFADHERFVREHGCETVVKVLGGPNDAAVRQLIVQLGLYDCWPKRIEVLSTGEVRKVLLARALIRQPRLLVLDKPYDGLDAASRERLRWILGQACNGFPPALVDTGMATRRLDGSTLALTTHRLAEVPAQMHRLWLLQASGHVGGEHPMPGLGAGAGASNDMGLAEAVAWATGAAPAEAAAAVAGWRDEAEGTMTGAAPPLWASQAPSACVDGARASQPRSRRRWRRRAWLPWPRWSMRPCLSTRLRSARGPPAVRRAGWWRSWRGSSRRARLRRVGHCLTRRA
jgi:ABC-type molybdenum transport system ATPase subunit/photorepair protein PhrA